MMHDAGMDRLQLAEECAREGRRLAGLGFMACTAGNISARWSQDPLQALMSPSGIDKSQLAAEGFLLCDEQARPVGGTQGKPSDETLLHLALYAATGCGGVAHGHPPHAVALSLIESGAEVVFEGIEMQKAFAGTATHACRRVLPVVENSQDMRELSQRVLAVRQAEVPAVLVRGHGVYAWGRTVAEAGRHLETVEWLCRLRWLMRAHP